MNEFDEKAKTWDLPYRVDRAKAVADIIREALPNGRSLTALEYGCGTGLVSFFLRDIFSSISLVDNSKGMLDVVREKILREGVTNMKAFDADALSEQIKSGITYNVLFSSMVLHHIIDTKKMLLEWSKCLAPNGHLIIVDLDTDNGLFHNEEFEGHNGFDRTELGKMLSETGFGDVKFKTAHEMEKVCKDGVNRKFTLFIMIARK